MDIAVLVGLLILGVVMLLLLWGEGLLVKKSTLAVAVVLTACALLLRGLCMDHETLDYQNFLTKWVAYFRNNGGWKALSGNVGNYNLPYLYFLALFSYSGIRDLYLIKFLSLVFDVLLAWGVLHLVSLFCGNTSRRLAAFFLPLFLPTVILNGAYWGQCDSIYAAFAVWAMVFALRRKGAASVVCIALSFAFKLQAVFFMPIYLIFLYSGRVKWWHLLFFPLTYFLVVLPAILLGRPALDTLLLYFNQAGSVGDGINYNSSSVFAFIPYGAVYDTKLYARLGIAAAFVFLALVFLWLWIRRDRISDRTLLAAALLICVGVPFFLPHMHDRYFFLADIFSLALALVVPPLSALPVLVSFASLLGYHAYLRMRYLLPMSYGAWALLLVLAVTAAYTAFTLHRRSSSES